MIRGIIFDCFGVLYGGSIDMLVAMAPKGKSRTVRDISNAKDYGYISYEEHLEQIGEILGKSADEIGILIHRRQIPNNGLTAYASTLKGECKVGLLSNMGDHTYDRLFGGDPSRLFDAVVLSYEEGMIKPDPNIFLLAAERLGLAAEECIMIDDLEANCDGARLAGMQAVLHTSNEITCRKVNELMGKA